MHPIPGLIITGFILFGIVILLTHRIRVLLAELRELGPPRVKEITRELASLVAPSFVLNLTLFLFLFLLCCNN